MKSFKFSILSSFYCLLHNLTQQFKFSTQVFMKHNIPRTPRGHWLENFNSNIEVFNVSSRYVASEATHRRTDKCCIKISVHPACIMHVHILGIIIYKMPNLIKISCSWRRMLATIQIENSFFAIYRHEHYAIWVAKNCAQLFSQVFKETVCKSIVELFRVLSLMIFKCLPFVFA